MKDKIVFFILGALLATIAYLAGDLETLTAQDKPQELERLKVGVLEVDNLRVKYDMYVGGNEKPFVRIVALNESADISLVGKGEDTSSLRLSVREDVGTGGYASISLIGGGEDMPSSDLRIGKGISGGYANLDLSGGGEDAPRMMMRVEKGIGVGIDGESHAKRPEARFSVFTVKHNGTFRSGMLVKDSRGTSDVDTGW